MSVSPAVRQPLATAVAGALLVLGVVGTAWATSGPEHPVRPDTSSVRTP